MHWTERLFNVLLGFTLLHWGIQTLLAGLNIPRVVLASLHLSVAILVLRRAPIKREASTIAQLASLPGILVGGAVFLLGPDPEQWTTFAQPLFVVGGFVTIVSLSFLGRSFAMLPAFRSIVVRGPYRWVRHPVYVGELLMIAGCSLGLPFWMMLGSMMVATLLVCLRVLVEERELSQEQDYQAYCRAVRFRLVPSLWSLGAPVSGSRCLRFSGLPA